jgi:hypothetical protein
MDATDYLSRAYAIIKENFRTSDASGGMTAASAAYLIKRALGDYEQFGFFRFKDVLEKLETAGQIRTGANAKAALSIWIAQPNQDSPPDVAKPENYRPLKSQVWFAFVSVMPPGLRFLHRHTGDVRVGLQISPGDGWVEIQSIAADSERSVARQFLRENAIEDTDLEQSISNPQWFVEFPRQLASKSPNLTFAWKRKRSSEVIAIAKQWCAANSIEQELIFDTRSSTLCPKTRRSAEPPPPSNRVKDDVRELLIAAVKQMSTDELLTISIPSQYLISVLRPDLAR